VEGILQCRSCLARAAAKEDTGRWRSAGAVLPTLVLLPLAWLLSALTLFGFVSLLGLVAEWTREI
jgi:hypothetical protein